MNYDVSWEDDAIDELQLIFNASHDREGLAQTVKRIGLQLRADPLGAGESREVGTRILFKFPLVVWFHVSERLRSVHIFDVRPMRQG